MSSLAPSVLLANSAKFPGANPGASTKPIDVARGTLRENRSTDTTFRATDRQAVFTGYVGTVWLACRLATGAMQSQMVGPAQPTDTPRIAVVLMMRLHNLSAALNFAFPDFQFPALDEYVRVGTAVGPKTSVMAQLAMLRTIRPHVRCMAGSAPPLSCRPTFVDATPIAKTHSRIFSPFIRLLSIVLPIFQWEWNP